MARRIDIELTSARPDGTWTWRAAGAMQPKGVLDGQLLYPEAKAGDVARAEADFEIDGITIVSVAPPKVKKRTEPERIELLAPSAPSQGVTTQLVGRGDRGGSGRRRDRDDGRSGEGRGPRPGGEGRGPRPGGERTSRDGPGGGRPAPRRTGREVDGGRGPSSDRGRGPAERSGGRGPDRAAGGQGGDDQRRRSSATEGRPARTRTERPAGAAAETAERASARRLNPGNVHRQAVMASLSPEQQPIAEQVLRGGIPAVRTAIHLEREKATAEGRNAPNADSLLAMAEELLPVLKAAEWRDRAEAAAKVADNLALRDLRAVVAGGDLARDDETRQLAASLREMLESRLARMREEWVTEITRQLDENRVVRALRLAARAPEATTRLSAEQSERLAAAASAAMAPDTAPDRWAALLEAVAASPVRRAVTPVGLPSDPGAALLTAAQQQVGRIPALAPLLGITMPPPPGPIRGGPPARPAQGSRPAPPRRRGPAGPRPPAPPTATATEPTTAAPVAPEPATAAPTSAPDPATAAPTSAPEPATAAPTSAPEPATAAPVAPSDSPVAGDEPSFAPSPVPPAPIDAATGVVEAGPEAAEPAVAETSTAVEAPEAFEAPPLPAEPEPGAETAPPAEAEPVGEGSKPE